LVDVAATAITKGAKFVEVTSIVNAQQLRTRGGTRGDDDEIALEVQLLDGRPHDARSFGALGVPLLFVAGVIVEPVDD
jgi:hypothetical protein